MDTPAPVDRTSTGRSLASLALAALALGWSAPGLAAPPSPTFDDDSAPQTFALKDTRKAGPSKKPARLTPSEKMSLELAAVPEVRLDSVDVERLLAEDEAARARTKVLRFGVGRDVSVSARDGNWYDLADGAKLWVGDVVSTDALALRLHVTGLPLPDGAELAVYAPAELQAWATATKAGSPAPVERRVEFAGATARPEGYWTSTVPGDRARLEYYVPAGAAADAELPFAVDRLQHVYLDPVATTALGLGKAAGPCHNDVTCHPEWADVARSVAGIGFINGNSLFCSGQLLNSTKPDFTPYWLTANHCLDDAAQAASAEIFWLYQTAACGGPPPSLASVPTSPGTTLLSTNPQSDYTLLLVEGTLPEGLIWSGWTSAKINDGVPATAIHHPSGDFKRISFGAKSENSICESNQLLRIDWTDAPTEPGSSGSGIFRNDTQQLFGQLFFGESRCGLETWDCYGAFNATFPKIKKLLAGGTDDKSEQNDSCKKSRLVKAGTQTGRIVKSVDTDWYKINVPKGKTLTVELTFAHAHGDIDLDLHPNCAAGPIATSHGTTDGEVVEVTNVGKKTAPVFLHVFLDGDVRNSYTLKATLR